MRRPLLFALLAAAMLAAPAGASVTYHQTDSTAVAHAFAAFCSGLSLSTGTKVSLVADGAQGTGTYSPSVQKSGTNALAVQFEIAPPAGTTWGAGTWTVNLNITTADSSLTWTAAYLCRVNASGVSQATIGSLTGQSVSLGSSGTKGMNVSGAAQTPSAGDVVEALLAFTNGNTHSTQSFSFTPSTISSPFTPPAVTCPPSFLALAGAGC